MHPNDPSPRPAPTRGPNLPTLVVAAAVSALAMTMFVPAVPMIANDFGSGAAAVQLGLAIYLVTTAIVQLIVGPLSDLYGRRPVLLWSMVLFVIGTLVCVFAGDVATFLMGRVLQGASSAGLVLSRTIIRDVYGRDKAASMIGYLVMAMAVAPMLGPWIGGEVAEAVGWQGIFVLLGIVGVISVLTIWRGLSETNVNLGRPIGTQFASYRALLSSRAYWVFAATGSCASAVFFAFLGAAPQIADTVLGMSPASYGAWFACCAGGYAFGNFLSGRFAERFGLGPMIVAGATSTLLGTAAVATAFAAGIEHPFGLFGLIALVGIGNGLVLPSNIAAAISIRTDAAGAASGLLGTIQTGTGAVASVIAAVVVGDGSAVMAFCAVIVTFGAIAFVFALLSLRELGGDGDRSEPGGLRLGRAGGQTAG